MRGLFCIKQCPPGVSGERRAVGENRRGGVDVRENVRQRKGGGGREREGEIETGRQGEKERRREGENKMTYVVLTLSSRIFGEIWTQYI